MGFEDDNLILAEHLFDHMMGMIQMAYYDTKKNN